ncbi:terpenoid synthase [Tilletiaria anomala UBC 951]|uniref:(2E,6E)-farnesyl diphosphate synthase n=1 Tax=Tilletiaria anomala (strain ATCC 24038 / CBS 436.72 / UBC 951) TaxID=1037660 RepID=A0A066WBM6_TILAU|nr:terpenoid synthase [Tilletiaria anomala UBC 951]KDN48185.1 terpenoid synthase [Tilletiaria anomala UBC 951]
MAARAGGSSSSSSAPAVHQAESATSNANLSTSPSTHAHANAAWYNDILSRLGKQPHWPQAKEQAIMEPYSYLDAHPGKEVRSQLIHAFNEWLQVPDAKLDIIRKVVRMLHTASLLMDDVEDNSDLRRGIPVAHRIYGIPQTINTANYVYFLVFEEIFKMSSSHDSAYPLAAGRVERLVAEEMINLHRGQGMDLFWRDSLTCPTEEEYVEMVINKTGGLFRIALKLMMAHSPLFVASNDASPKPRRASPPNLLPLADLIGLLFQIRDDYMNLQSSEYADNKGFAEDLTEGKFSFPIIHAIRSSVAISPISHVSRALDSSTSPAGTSTPPVVSFADPFRPIIAGDEAEAPFGSSSVMATAPNRQILNVLKQRPTDLATKSYAVSYMREATKSFNYTRDVLRRLDVQARAEVVRIQAELASDADAAAGARTGATGLLKILDALRSGWYDVHDDP